MSRAISLVLHEGSQGSSAIRAKIFSLVFASTTRGRPFYRGLGRTRPVFQILCATEGNVFRCGKQRTVKRSA